MLTAIDFDNEFRSIANKIDNISTKWDLTTELISAQLLTSQIEPQLRLGIRHAIS
jgi:hypothetical protein